MGDDSVPWSVAWRRAAHGADGFYGQPHGRAEDHFVTSVMTGESVARTVVEFAGPGLTHLADDGARLTVTDVGAADGALLLQLRRAWPEALRPVTDWRAIDVRERPPGLDPAIVWHRGDVGEVSAALAPCPGLVVAHELLDDIPCDVVETDDEGVLRLVLVDPATGMQTMGPALDDGPGCARIGIDGAEVSDWCAAWWPRREPAARIEVGLPRDAAWRSITSLVSDGVSIAVDYGHMIDERAAGRWDGGSIAAYLNGRLVTPVPDGSRNITAHVALDACAAATGVRHTRLVRVRAEDDLWWLVQSTLPLP